MTDPALLERITRSLAFMLRHQPETFDLELDPQGFADLEDVVHALNERLGEPVEEEDVREAVRSGDRPRYEIQGTTIRALYGHSIPVEPGPSSKPPELLYVAIPEREMDRARSYGLRGGRRRFLHLGLTRDDALDAGRRTARDYAVLVIQALDAWEEGISFYDRQALWLAEEIPTHLIDLEGTYHDGTDPLERSHDGHREHSHRDHRDRDNRRGRGHGHGRGGHGRDRGDRRDAPRSRPSEPQMAPAAESGGEPRGGYGREMREGGQGQGHAHSTSGPGSGGGEPRDDRGRRRGGRGRGRDRDRDQGPRERSSSDAPAQEAPAERRERASAPPPPPPPPAVRPSPPARAPAPDRDAGGRPFGAGLEGGEPPPERRPEPRPRPQAPAPPPRTEPERSDDRPAFGAGL